MVWMGVPAALSNRLWARLRARKAVSSFIVFSKSSRCSSVKGCTYLTIITSSGRGEYATKIGLTLMRYCINFVSPKSAERPRHSCRGWIGVGRAGLNAQEPNKTHAVPEPLMGEGTAEVEAPAFMPGRMFTESVDYICPWGCRQCCSAGVSNGTGQSLRVV